MHVNLGKRKLSPFLKKTLFLLFASLPVILYVGKFSLVYRHGIFQGEDWDEFAQMYEAARQSILHYHQFPWWNPWSVGGEPLFANPQFGLFSLQMPLVLLFGTIEGLHLAIGLYFLLGFWGMYALLCHVSRANKHINLLLSYIWVFSGFPVWHLGGGHLTFAVYLIAPWVILTTLNITRPRWWIWCGLATSLIINTAPHYMTIQTLMAVAALATFQISKSFYASGWNLRTIIPTLKPYIWTSILILILSGAKLFYTLQFLHEYPRLDALDDKSIPFSILISALTSRSALDPHSIFNGVWSWSEYANYIGIITVALFSYLLIKRLLKLQHIKSKEWFLLGSIALCILLYLGSFSALSPYNLLHHLPIFSQMRVPSRYIAWVALGILAFLSQLPKRKLVYILLIISVLDVFTANYAILNYPEKKYIPPQSSSKIYEPYAYYDTNGAANLMELNTLRLLRGVQSNIGEVYGYEPILGLGEYYNPTTIRCGINQGCNFVLTNNATVTYWSPQKIVLKRTRPGVIKLDMNPGKVWLVNGKAVFKNDRVLELGKNFTITDTTSSITVSYTPAL